MKRDTPTHPKTRALARCLGESLRGTCGLLELLFHTTAAYAPQGDIGRLSDEAIAAAVDWPAQRAGELMDALIECRWLERSRKHRLILHDWHDHAGEAARKYLRRHKLPFLSRPDLSGTTNTTNAEKC